MPKTKKRVLSKPISANLKLDAKAVSEACGKPLVDTEPRDCPKCLICNDTGIEEIQGGLLQRRCKCEAGARLVEPLAALRTK